MPRLVKLYIQQVLVGFGLSAVFVGLLLWLDVANLWHLVTHTSGGMIAVVMLWVFNGIVFAGVQFSISIMRMGRDEDGGGGRRAPEPVLLAEPVPVRAEERRS
ncbi:hypothetical protein SAMN04490248_102238 [Salinihabitans flavidus]|uniref:Uncharacterized protein n=1 Tax=Salinihabitans flavidus TaxID=569882 RepID=A0A1H8MSN4_9RHOB|nr:hypothetical protein [Salinihabitans flavidus]SEO20425.1 hypothetical protein SAMN04490248_102238 [Salinihabitans flavidus]